MSLTTIYPFNTPSNYIYDTDKIGVTGGKAQLKLQSASLPFIQNFDNDTGLTYDSVLAEFAVGRVRQKDQRPSNAIIAADFDNSLDANWAKVGFVDSSAGINGSPSLSGNKLLCDYAVNSGENGIYYSDAIIGNLSGDWVAKFKYTPQYSTSPPENINIFSISQASGSTDDITIFNSPSGNNIRITANGLSAITFATWEPTASQEYVFEIFCVSNQVTVWIDGVQLGTAKTISPAQGTDSVRVWLGAYPNVYNVASGSFDDFILYDTASQDETYTFPATIYATNNVILPEMEHVGDGSILAFDSFVTDDGSAPRYTLQIGRSGDYLYWTGSAWAVSDGTYAQANDETTFNANVGSLPVAGEKYGQFKIHFDDQNTQAYVETLTATMTVNTGYPTDSPTIEPVAPIGLELLDDFQSVINASGSDAVRFTLKKGNDFYYWDGAGWVVADDTYAQTNTVAEIVTNRGSFTDVGVTFKWKAFLYSDDGSSSPDVDSVTTVYDFFSPSEDVNTCVVYGYNKTGQGLTDSNQFVIVPSDDAIEYLTQTVIRDTRIVVIPDSVTGYWEVELVETENMPPSAYYEFRFKNKILRKDVPNAVVESIWDLPDV